ncbi:MAG TPA: DUF1444 family protein [Alphaproteobacteria bacterium]|nr:DUF1444 family protein [Alphaproteobacteria bacterium]
MREMTGRFRHWVYVAFFVVAFLFQERAQAAPNDPDAYTEHVAKLFADAAPDLTIAVTGRLTLSIKAPDAERDMQAALDRVWEYCRRNQAQCDNATETYVRNSLGMMRELQQPVERSMLRVVVRTAPYVEQIRKTFSADQKPNSQIVAAPLAADLWIVCVADFPNSVRFINRGDLVKLGLREQEVLALGRENVSAALRPLGIVAKDLPANGIGYIEGDDYESSRILLHEEWAQLAGKMAGDLIVAVPGSGLILYGDAGRAETPRALAELARHMLTRSQRPISATVLKWRPAGWEPLSPLR